MAVGTSVRLARVTVAKFTDNSINPLDKYWKLLRNNNHWIETLLALLGAVKWNWNGRLSVPATSKDAKYLNLTLSYNIQTFDADDQVETTLRVPKIKQITSRNLKAKDKGVPTSFLKLSEIETIQSVDIVLLFKEHMHRANSLWRMPSQSKCVVSIIIG